MSSEIYKAQAENNGEWVFGYFLVVDDIPYILPEGRPLNEIVQVRPDTVCKGSGLVDHDGAPIFQDDIVMERLGQNDTGVVRYGAFSCGCCSDVYGFKIDGGMEKFYGSGNECVYLKVIGNVHDQEVKA